MVGGTQAYLGSHGHSHMQSPNWGWDHWWAPTTPPVGTQAWGMRLEGGMSVPGWGEVPQAHLGGHSPSHMKALIGGGTTGGHPQPHQWVPTAPLVGTHAWDMMVEGDMSVLGWGEVPQAHLGGHSPSHMKALIGGGTTGGHPHLIGGGTTGGHPQPHHSVGTWSLPCGTLWRGTM